MDVQIERSVKNNDEITVCFDNNYYAHSIISLGKEEDAPERMNTMWAWINHMRDKVWWHSDLEERFKEEVKKHL